MKLEDFIARNPDSYMANVAINSFEYRIISLVGDEVDRLNLAPSFNDMQEASTKLMACLTQVLARTIVSVSYADRDLTATGVECCIDELKDCVEKVLREHESDNNDRSRDDHPSQT